jgi:hypothetical protein
MKMMKYLYHFSTSLEKRQEIINQMNSAGATHNIPTLGAIGPRGYFNDQNNNNIDLRPYLKKLYDFYPVGFANTLGYAHPSSGDTMSSVMIGGLRTVMNGDFEVFAGDPIQWYWTFEVDCFHPNGKRKKILNGAGAVVSNADPALDYNAPAAAAAPGVPGGAPDQDPRVAHRRIHNDFQYGISPDSYSPANKAKNVARIKPYMPDDEQPRLYDWVRVFAVAISSARPNEMVDIKISKQSL